MHSPIIHSRSCQRDRLLALLKSRAPERVPLPDVMAVAGAQYGARVHELRGLGHRIENNPGWFRLATNPTTGLSQPQPLFTQDLLFGDLEPIGGYPD